MSYIPPSRNYDFIDKEELRRLVEPPFTLAHDELTSVYYDFWKKGLSCVWKGYDKKETVEASKEQFDNLHGLIFYLQDVALYEANAQDPTPLTDEELRINIEETRANIESLTQNGYTLDI